MKILHLTDFHFSSEAKHMYDQQKLVESLVADLKAEKDIDFILFTGDLVNTGNDSNDFFKAKKMLLLPLSESLNIPINNIIVCCGNHDVYRGQELQETAEKINTIQNNDELEEFLKRQDGKSFEESLKNLKNYNDFQKAFYYDNSKKTVVEINDLYTIHKFTIKENRIGVLSLNTAWRAIDSLTDRGNLLYPMSILKQAIHSTYQDTDFRILIMHHPFSDFKYWNASDMEDSIYKDFQLLFSGHLHKNKQSININEDVGTLWCQSAATLTLDGGAIGYSLININIGTYDIEIRKRHYDKKTSIFIGSEKPFKGSIPVGQVKTELISFKKTISKRYFNELERADDLFLFHDGSEIKKGFSELFTNPILKNKTQAEIAAKSADQSFRIEEIQKSTENYLIHGKDKSGKTSILYKILLNLLSEYSTLKVLPVYIDALEFKKSGKILDVNKYISTYYEINKAKAESLPTTYRIKLLIDNYEHGYESFNQQINSYLQKVPNATFIAVTEQNLASSFIPYKFDDRKYLNLYIHEISQTEVRTLTNKWPNLSSEKKELILEKIYQVFIQLSIPINYWTVSLFIWIFEINNDANFRNSFELIQLYIDSLLERKNLALDRSSKLKFEDYKSYLAELAFFLMKDRAAKGYTATYTELVDFTNEYRAANKRFVIEVKEILDLVIQKNILRKVFEDVYTFRLNGVFEYFIALYLSKNQELLDEAINDDHYYLSFKNELELCAGFMESNEEFLKKIFEKTKIICQTLWDNYSNEPIDRLLDEKIENIYDISAAIKQLDTNAQKALSESEQDEIYNEFRPVKIEMSEVKVKKYYENIPDTGEELEKAIYILARVYRNGNVQKEELNNLVLDYLLNSACYLGFKFIDEAEENKFGLDYTKVTQEKARLIVQLIKNFMPIIVQTFLFESIAQNDLERILKDKINELKKDAKNNQFKLTLLYFTLIDLNLNQHKNLINEVIELITSPILRQTSLIKLYVYLLFKCYNKPSLESFIKESIRKLSIKINSKADKASLQKNISQASKFAKRNKMP